MTEISTYSRRRLSYVVAEVSKRLKVIPLHGLTPGLEPLVEASGAFVRGCWEAAKGVLILAVANEYSGIVAVERQAWEMWSDLEFLLLSADPPRNGLKVQINALIELVELLSVLGIPNEMLAENKQVLTKFELSHPDVVAEVKAQRKRNRHHWSGQSRTSIVGKTEASRAVYKMLSWEAHPDMGPIRDISTEVRDGVSYLLLNEPEDIGPHVERSASSTSECLLRAWNAFADSFGQSRIDDAPPRKQGESPN